MRKITEQEAIELAKSNYCRIIVNTSKSQKKLDTFHRSLLEVSKNNHKIELIDASEIVSAIDNTKIEESISKESTALDVTNAYLEEIQFDTSIDKVYVKEIMEQLYREAMIQQREGDVCA